MCEASRVERERRFWDKYLKLLHDQGVKPPSDRWHVVRAEGFIRAFPGQKLAELTAERVCPPPASESSRGLFRR